MNISNQSARSAGAIYLVIILSGFFSLMYVPSKISNWSDPSSMINNVMTHQMLFRVGIVVEIIGFIGFLLLPLAFYKLLSEVNKTQAILMVAFALVSVPLSFVNLLNKFAVLTLLSKVNYLNGVDSGQLHTQILLHLDYVRNGNQLASIFWGLWLFPLGFLVFKSGFLPKLIGVLLMLGCFGYVFNFLGDFLFEEAYNQMGIGRFITMPASLGELGICLWLLIAGVREHEIKK
jgi:hypothetical protein